MKKHKTSYMFKKIIDLEKAFDGLELSFNKYMMEYVDFPDHLKKLIPSCISTSTLSVLIIGNPFQGI